MAVHYCRNCFFKAQFLDDKGGSTNTCICEWASSYLCEVSDQGCCELDEYGERIYQGELTKGGGT